MSLFTSPLERRLWLAAAGLLATIYLTLAWVRPVTDALRDRGLVRAAMIGAFLVVAAGAAWVLARTRPGWREIAVLLPFAAFYLVVLSSMDRAEEAFHFVEYGVLAALIHSALTTRSATAPPRPTAGPLRRALGSPAFLTVVVTSAAGWLDEGIQHLLPGRYYDVRDLVFNAVAAVVAVAALSAWRVVARRKGQRWMRPPGRKVP